VLSPQSLCGSFGADYGDQNSQYEQRNRVAIS